MEDPVLASSCEKEVGVKYKPKRDVIIGIQSLERSTFPFLRSFTVRSPSVHRELIVRSSFTVLRSAFTVHKAFSVRSPFVHLSFTKRSSFIQRSVFIVIRNSEVERSNRDLGAK